MDDSPRGVPVRAFAFCVAAWTVVWLGAAVWISYEVSSLKQLSTTVVESGSAVQATGDALQRLGSLPVVGDEIIVVGRRVSTAGVSAQRSGRSTRSVADRLAILLGLAVGLAPTVPMIALFVVTRRLAVDPTRT